MFNTISRYILSRTTRFSNYAIQLAADCKANGHYSRSANYLTAIRSFTKAVGELSLNKIDKTVLAHYKEWMHRSELVAELIGESGMDAQTRHLRQYRILLQPDAASDL